MKAITGTYHTGSSFALLDPIELPDGRLGRVVNLMQLGVRYCEQLSLFIIVHEGWDWKLPSRVSLAVTGTEAELVMSNVASHASSGILDLVLTGDASETRTRRAITSDIVNGIVLWRARGHGRGKTWRISMNLVAHTGDMVVKGVLPHTVSLPPWAYAIRKPVRNIVSDEEV